MGDTLWPLRGLWQFLCTPRWWIRPLIATVAAWLVLAAVFVLVAWWRWPDDETSGWRHWLFVLFALGQAGAGLLLAWMLVLPVLLSVAMETLARQVQQQAGVTPVVELSAWRSFTASLRVIGGTLVPRLGWAAGSVALSYCAGPVGLIAGAVGMGYVACLDAADLALAVRGLTGKERLAALRAHRSELWHGALVAGLLNLGLAASVVGWLVWLPGLVAGAAKLVLGWPEASVATQALVPVVGAPAISPPPPG